MKMRQIFDRPTLVNNLISLGICCVAAVVLEWTVTPLFLSLGGVPSLAIAITLMFVCALIYMISALLFLRPTEEASPLSILAPTLVMFLVMLAYLRFLPAYATAGRSLSAAEFETAQFLVYFTETVNPVLRWAVDFRSFMGGSFVLQPSEVILVVLSFALPLLALLAGLLIRKGCSARFGEDSAIIVHAIRKSNERLADTLVKATKWLEPIVGEQSKWSQKRLSAGMLALVTIGFVAIVVLGGSAVINLLGQYMQSAGTSIMETVGVAEPLPDTRTDPEILEVVVGTYLEEVSYVAELASFGEGVDFIHLSRELLLTFNSDMTFEFVLESGLGIPHIKGNFTVETVSIDDVSEKDKLGMKDIYERNDASLYRIVAQGYESGFRTRFDMYMSRRGDGDVVIYLPSFGESIFVELVSS